MIPNNIPDIFNYIDFRKYLEDYYSSRKRVDKGFTHLHICNRLGQKNAKSYFNNVIKGRTNVTPTFVDRFISVLELKQEEAMYFRALVNYNQTTSPNEKEFFFDQLVRLNRTPHYVMDKNAYAYYSEWYHSAVRALLDIVDFKNDYKQLANKIFPPITLKQARDSIQLLKDLGIIAENDKGHLKPTDKVIVTGEFIKDAVVKQFQMKCLEHAKNVIANDGVKGHRNITLTVSASEKAYDRISARINQFKTEIRSIVHKDELPPVKVHNLNINFFPMSS
jgi:uncharacterized protein (TIGR02147 family)